MKIHSKRKIKPIIRERKVMEEMDHPFIVKLYWAFQSKDELYLVMDLCTGGEIFYHLSQFKRFPEDLARFYFTEIILGLEYLHSKGIMYRDLKPENILLDIDGHIRIADFGLCKKLEEGLFSYSFCGSPEYMSPEMLAGVGHDRRIDFYCLGAILYEMLTGLPPFFSKEKTEMYSNILEGELSYPDFISQDAKDLMDKLLTKEPDFRISSFNTSTGENGEEIPGIKDHPWLKGTKWERVKRKLITPPWQPNLRENNFDENEMEFRLSTERPYYESTVQSRTRGRENSLYASFLETEGPGTARGAILNLKSGKNIQL